MESRITITDIANRANCSIASVSRLLNEPDRVHYKTKKRIYTAMQELGYDAEIPSEYVLKESAISRNKLILIIVPSIENPFYNQIVEGISSSGRRLGYQYILYPVGNQSFPFQDIVDIIKYSSASGVITLCPVPEVSQIDTLEKMVPLVQCCEYNEDSNASFVTIDDFAASKSAVSYLISRGRKKIALVNSPRSLKYARQRLAGYEAALKEAGLEIDPRFIAEIPQIDFNVALAIISQILNWEEKPDAIFAVSDVFATAAIKASINAGFKVPEDISVVGFDNTFISVISSPSLTTVSQPQFQLGVTACEVLMQKMSYSVFDQKHIFLDTELVIRESS